MTTTHWIRIRLLPLALIFFSGVVLTGCGKKGLPRPIRYVPPPPMEDLEGSELLKAHTESLGALTQHKEARVRGDACYYLALSHDPSVHKWIEALLDDPDDDVREVAQDSLAILAVQ